MEDICINTAGRIFFEKNKKQLKIALYIMPFTLLFILLIGYIKLGLSMYSIVVTLFLLPVWFIYVYKSYFEPKDLLNRLIVKIEFDTTHINFHTNTLRLNGMLIKNTKTSISIFKDVFVDLYTIKADEKEFYILIDYFDDKETLKRILGAN